MFESTELFLFWIASTWIVATLILGIYQRLKATNAELTLKLHRQLDGIIHRVRVEKQSNTYYWYDMDNNTFLAQGTSDEEIIAILKRRFPTHMFFLPTHHLICAKTDWQPKTYNI